VAGVIVTAVGDELLILDAGSPLSTAGILMVLGGPILFLAGETLFRVRMIGSANAKRLAAIAALGLLGIEAGRIPALVLVTIVAVVLIGLAVWEYERARPAALQLGVPDAVEGVDGTEGVGTPPVRT